jgi:hypothetical protein
MVVPPICVGAGVTGVHILPVRHPYPLPPAVALTDHCRRSASQYLFLVMMPTREWRCLQSIRVQWPEKIKVAHYFLPCVDITLSASRQKTDRLQVPIVP